MDTTKKNIPINFQQLMEAVKQLSPKEKLKLNEIIWDENGSIPIEHQELVMDRIKRARQNPETMLDWEEASKRLVP